MLTQEEKAAQESFEAARSRKRKVKLVSGITARNPPSSMRRALCSKCMTETLFVADGCIHCGNPLHAKPTAGRRGPGRPPKGWNGAVKPAPLASVGDALVRAAFDKG